MIKLIATATFADGFTSESIHEVPRAEGHWFINHYSTLVNDWPNAELVRVVVRVEML